LGRSASHTAAHKLGQILGLLIIPILVLWSIYFIGAKAEIDSLNREITGVVLARAGLETGPLKADATKSKALERALALPAEAASGGALSYLDSVREHSGLVIDSERQSHALAEIGLTLIPQLQHKIELLNAKMGRLGGAGDNVARDNHMLLLTVGDLRSIVTRIENNLKFVGIATQRGVATEIASLRNLSSALEKTTTDPNNPDVPPHVEQAGWVTSRIALQNDMAQSARAVQFQVIETLKTRLEGRRGNAWRTLVMLTLAGAASALAGIGLAVLMMRSTLLRLDEVEVARKTANDARREAEQMALRFSTINADISRLNEDLAGKMRELHAAQDELIKRGRLEQLGQVTATIAHEIRNPLGAIRTSAFLLDRKISKFGVDAGGHLERINNSVNRCDTIISQLLDFSRTKEVNSTLALLDEWVAKTVREEAQRLPENIFIECSLGLEGIRVAFDPARLQRAIINLLSNASEALQSQTDSASRQDGHPQRIWITTLRAGDFAAIRINDNGPGIAAEYLQKIREPLFTTKSFGTGLGIPAVEQIANQHNGRLDISSELGRGATFTIHLPLLRSLNHAA
jgi:signal transduction histidine kinase